MFTTLRAWLPYLVVFGCLLPFLGKPVHIDDANFLRLAEGAQEDFWRPHDVLINWQGETERAFDVLSNPPGIAWWLAPVTDKPVWFLHLWMWPWVLLALWGMGRLGRELVGSREAAILALGLSPMMMLSAQGLTPDMPLLACTAAGLGGFLSHRKTAWLYALLAGFAVWFRYSGVCVIPLVVLAGALNKKLVSSLFVCLPFAALLIHDWHAYGELHVWAMREFQAVSNSPEEVFLKGAALLAMLGGMGVMPPLSWSSRGFWALLIGGALGLSAGLSADLGLGMSAVVALFCGSGALGFSRLGFSSRSDLLVTSWAIGGAVFLLGLRFAATRYWLLFLPAFVLAALRLRLSQRRLTIGLALSALLGLGLSVDDMAFAKAHRGVAEEVASLGKGSFAGHWGFQHYLEKEGWRPLEEGRETESLHAVFVQGWPQEAAADTCLQEVGRLRVRDRWWGPRTHSYTARVNVHANWISGMPPRRSLLPWGFSDEPYAEVRVSRVCQKDSP
ncbi:MAG: hypothetical protein VXW32_01065 [Myxococcota bacterium]|nr:hypothetical protein [Myxococcota bacterium]